MKFNEKLIELRKATGFSQEELANKLNVARQTVSKWELGETTPEMDKLVKLSEIFNVTLDELIKDENDNDNQKNSDNKIKSTNSQKLAGMVIKILKGLGILLLVLLIISIFLMIIGLVSFNRISVDSTVVEVQEETNVEFKE